MLLALAGCEYETSGTRENIDRTKEVTDTLANSQQSPTDISYSLERYNLIRRAYWVNGQKDKADALPCPIVKPFGYIVITAGNTVLGRFEVDGKVSSLNSFLSPDYVESYYSNGGVINTELADVDGSYGQNDNGIFFFTPDGHYVEKGSDYLYSDLPLKIDDPAVQFIYGGD